MNIARRTTGSALRFRTYATAAYVPPASLEGFQRRGPPPPKPKPESPTFYTGRPNYFDQLLALESAAKYTRSALRQLELLPLPSFAQENLPPLHPMWKSKDEIAELMDENLTMSRYRRFLGQLNQLNEYHRLAALAGHAELARRIQSVLGMFERENKEAILAQRQRKPVKFDEFGRSYTVGRRKESTARVWAIAAQPSPEEQVAAAAAAVAEAEAEVASSTAEPAPEAADAPTLDPLSSFIDSKPSSALDTPATGIAGFESGPLSQAPGGRIEVPMTNILINNTPLAEYL